MAVDPNKSEYGLRVIYAGVPSVLGFGAGGRSPSNFLASTEGLVSAIVAS